MIPNLANTCGVFEEYGPLFVKNLPFDMLEKENVV